MDSLDVDRIRHALNTETVRRLLIRYFVDRGFDNFNRLIYPAQLMDLPAVVPPLADKIEVIPYAESVDPFNNRAKIGWNLFVLGNRRMYLGETQHRDLSALARMVKSGAIMEPELGPAARRQTTPRRIITFITRILGESEAGFVDLTPGPPVPGLLPHTAQGVMAGSPGALFARAGFGT